MYERVSRRLAARSEAPLEAVSERPNPHGFRIFEHGKRAFEEILKRVSEARESVSVRAFLWRDDEAGRRFGEAVLSAANRGVKIRIQKDRNAAVYEYGAGSRQSFFHKRALPSQTVQAWLLRAINRERIRGKQTPNPLAENILAHPNITVEHQHRRFDHSKLFVFDRRLITLGSMGIGDNHLNDWVDVMVELDGAEHVTRLEQRISGEVDFDPDRDIDFLVHNRQTAKKRHCPMLDQRLALIEAARESLTIEMAYLGDRRFTTGLLRAVRRGVEVTLVTAARADVLGNVNRTTCNTLMQRTGFAKNLRIILMPRMVHSKIVIVDHKIADIGSANFTALSHGVYDEINLYAVDTHLAGALEQVIIEAHAAEGEEADQRLGIDRLTRGIERFIVAYQSRNAARLKTSQRQMPRAKILELKRAEREHARQERQERRTERSQERRQRRKDRRQERAVVREAKRAGRAGKREAKRAGRADKRKARAERRQTRSAAKRESRADKHRRRASDQSGPAGEPRTGRKDRRQARAAAKRAARKRKRERRQGERQRQKQTRRTGRKKRDSQTPRNENSPDRDVLPDRQSTNPDADQR